MKKKCLEKGRQYYAENKERLQKIAGIDTGDYMKKKKLRKENTQEIDTTILLKKQTKTNRI